MSKITGDEFVTPHNVVSPDGRFAPEFYHGETLRQRALREFMCSLIQSQPGMPAQYFAELADEYVTAYLNQLNK